MMRVWAKWVAVWGGLVGTAGAADAQIGVFMGGPASGSPVSPTVPWLHTPDPIRAVAISDIVTMSLNPLNAGMVVLAVGADPRFPVPLDHEPPLALPHGGPGLKGAAPGTPQQGGGGGGGGGGSGGGGGGGGSPPGAGGEPPVPPAPSSNPPPDGPFVAGLTPQTVWPQPIPKAPLSLTPETSNPSKPGPGPGPGPGDPEPPVEAPEPATLFLVGIGAATLGLSRLRRA